jgi:integrase
MASIKKRPNGKWRARYRDEAKKEHSRHFDRKTDAQDWLDEVTATVVTGTYADPKRGALTFDQWWAVWSERQVWATGTTEAATTAFESVTFGSVRMRDIRPSHLEKWVKAMSQPTKTRKKGLEPSTITTRFNYVRAAFAAAVRDRVIGIDPATNIKLPRRRRAEAAMTIPEPLGVRKALEAAPKHFSGFIAVCAFAGLRLGEAAALQVSDIDFLRRTITVNRQIQGSTAETTTIEPPKYGSERTIHVPRELLTMISSHIEKFAPRGDERWIFWNPNGDERGLWNRNSASQAWRTTRRQVGLDAYTLHDLRHFYASGLIADNCDVVTVQRALGHSSPTITLGTYAHLWPSAEDKTRAAATSLMQTVLSAQPVAEAAKSS